MLIRDTLTLALDNAGLTKTADGYLVGRATVARAGNVQDYLGREIGLTGDSADKVFGVYRDPDVVFDKASMATLAGRPVTINHPDEPVTSDNHSKLSVGHIGGSIARDGEHIVAQMAITDAKAVKTAENGDRWLSAGYTVDTVPSVGISPDGQHYQFKQSGKVTFNHVALLDGQEPRAGNTRFGDSQIESGLSRAQWRGAIPTSNKMGDSVMTEKTTQFVRDGLSVTLPTSEAQFVTKMFADADKKYDDMKAKYDQLEKDMAELKGKKDALKADMDKMKKNAPDDAKLDAMADARAALKSKAKAILGDSFDGTKTSGEIKLAVVQKTLGDSVNATLAAMADDAARAIYVDAVFATVQAQSKPKSDPFRSEFANAKPVNDRASMWDSFLTKGEA